MKPSEEIEQLIEAVEEGLIQETWEQGFYDQAHVAAQLNPLHLVLYQARANEGSESAQRVVERAKDLGLYRV